MSEEYLSKLCNIDIEKFDFEIPKTNIYLPEELNLFEYDPDEF